MSKYIVFTFIRGEGKTWVITGSWDEAQTVVQSKGGYIVKTVTPDEPTNGKDKK